MSMAPQKAILAETGEVVAARDVKVNTVIAVKAGEVIPIDGVVVDGRSEVDESTLTGESFPVSKQPDSQVWAGTLNIDGNIWWTVSWFDVPHMPKMSRCAIDSVSILYWWCIRLHCCEDDCYGWQLRGGQNGKVGWRSTKQQIQYTEADRHVC